MTAFPRKMNPGAGTHREPGRSAESVAWRPGGVGGEGQTVTPVGQATPVPPCPQ